ncbi:DUF4054 domain-containing protein [Mesorhizobium sp. BR1-1-16]|uniref:DUF4054 domain-containing protein n=1 Tax=Mesorhizobium sp. BR1-1-16 TaxID=2876653 RepID=UPI001CC97DF5|nr:DUF4054 domain-containing protein [Mesorhizobium sp. BR1-1-16]MBZ9939142.1 DUF4054 domain-containing protein [Mesorhizobium sp. BR1-1-16]
MTVTVAKFIADYPEFYDGPDPQPASSIVQGWIDFAAIMLPADRWGAALDRGIELYVAHHIALQMKGAAVGRLGGIPGQVQGPLASKTVDKVSMSYDTGAVAIEGAGDWNLTVYGVQFQRLARMFGAGGIQL